MGDTLFGGRGGRYHFRIAEGDLACGHTGIFAEVGPGGVDDCYVVFLVACNLGHDVSAIIYVIDHEEGFKA